MKNLIAQVKKQYREDRKKFIQGIEEAKDNKSLIDKWYYNHLLTKGQKQIAEAMGLKDLKDILLKREDKKQQKRMIEDINHIEGINKYERKIDKITLTVIFTKNRTWGVTVKAEAQVDYKDNTREHFTGSVASGCGYDKHSQATANVLNMIPELKKVLYTAKNKKATESNHKLLGYGSGYGILPHFEGGVGIESHRRIFEGLKAKFETIDAGKNCDIHVIKF